MVEELAAWRVVLNALLQEELGDIHFTTTERRALKTFDGGVYVAFFLQRKVVWFDVLKRHNSYEGRRSGARGS